VWYCKTSSYLFEAVLTLNFSSVPEVKITWLERLPKSSDMTRIHLSVVPLNLRDLELFVYCTVCGNGMSRGLQPQNCVRNAPANSGGRYEKLALDRRTAGSFKKKRNGFNIKFSFNIYAFFCTLFVQRGEMNAEWEGHYYFVQVIMEFSCGVYMWLEVCLDLCCADL
jgi:hypothetical protein